MDVTTQVIEEGRFGHFQTHFNPDLSYREVDTETLLEAVDRLLFLTRDASNGWRQAPALSATNEPGEATLDSLPPPGNTLASLQI